MRGHRKTLDFSCKTFPFFRFAQICFNNGNSRDVEGSISCISGNWIGYAGKKGPRAVLHKRENVQKKKSAHAKKMIFSLKYIMKTNFWNIENVSACHPGNYCKKFNA